MSSVHVLLQRVNRFNVRTSDRSSRCCLPFIVMFSDAEILLVFSI